MQDGSTNDAAQNGHQWPGGQAGDHAWFGVQPAATVTGGEPQASPPSSPQEAPQQHWPPAPQPYGNVEAWPGQAQGYPPPQQFDPSTGQPYQPQQPQAWPPQYQSGQQGAYYPQPGYQQPVYQKPPSKLEQMKGRGGIGGAIAAFLLFLAKGGASLLALLTKFKLVLILGKFVLTFGSMLLSMWLWSYRFGWPLAVVFVLSIFFHECGHAVAGKSRGIAFSNMVFIPFMGAAVLLKRGGRSVGEDAFIGIMGPVFGALYALGCLGLGLVMHSTFWLVAASMIAFMNLFNLIPMAPLDGGWIVPVFSPKWLAIGAFLLIPVSILVHNPLIGLLGLLSLPRVIAGWKSKPEDSEYFRATPSERLTYAIAYPALAAVLGITMFAAQYLFSIAQGLPMI